VVVGNSFLHLGQKNVPLRKLVVGVVAAVELVGPRPEQGGLDAASTSRISQKIGQRGMNPPSSESSF
jgi:hypothetical protein